MGIKKASDCGCVGSIIAWDCSCVLGSDVGFESPSDSIRSNSNGASQLQGTASWIEARQVPKVQRCRDSNRREVVIIRGSQDGATCFCLPQCDSRSRELYCKPFAFRPTDQRIAGPPTRTRFESLNRVIGRDLPFPIASDLRSVRSTSGFLFMVSLLH